MCQQNAQHTAQRFRRTPQQLVTDGERTDVRRAHGQFADSTNGDVHRASHLHGRQVTNRCLTGVGHHGNPFVVVGDHCFDVGQGHIFLQLEGQGLAVTAHRANTYAETIDGDSAGAKV